MYKMKCFRISFQKRLQVKQKMIHAHINQLKPNGFGGIHRQVSPEAGLMYLKSILKFSLHQRLQLPPLRQQLPLPKQHRLQPIHPLV